MTDRYAVIGHPVAHSKSPQIHRRFAAQTGQDLHYDALLAPLDGFAETVRGFIADGGCGLNVTVPFKEEAYRLVTRLTDRARAAGAVNTLSFRHGEILGDNTDGAGIVRDIRVNLAQEIAGRRVLLLGAGGAARGSVLPLLQEAPACLVIANRTAARARTLAEALAAHGKLRGCGFAELSGQSFDIVINATSAGLSDAAPEIPDGVFAPDCLAYDMLYGRETPFMAQARRAGARVSDGLGMLVEQAAEAFLVWRGLRPDTLAVLAELRRS
ncbi:shikimate dehydrogenase [Sterolibacterium denitrificans]|nr:shikimate dehydrogenase [Sterolibacterium denitrificans]